MATRNTNPTPTSGEPATQLCVMNRRSFLGFSAAAASSVLGPAAAAERDWSGSRPARYPDSDIVVLDERFAKYKVGNTALQRLWTGALWAEGCAWSAGGRYLVWSDIPNNRILRRVDEDGHVSVFRSPSNNTNGNTFDFEGRLISCEHNTQRVIRFPQTC
jgi:gluconolactonase